MKITSPKTQTCCIARRKPTFTKLGLTALLAFLAGVSLSPAAVFVKTNNVDNLNLATSWTNNVVPGASDTLQWDATVSDVNNTTNTLGANLSVAGIKILNPAGPVVVVTNSGGNTLTVGKSGIDMSSATVDLTMSNNITLPDYTLETWTVPAGRTFSLQGGFSRSGWGALMKINNAGTINMLGGTASTFIGYALLNDTDVAAWDASKNVSSVATVIGYSGNVVGGVPTTQYIDMINSATGTTDDVYENTSITFPRVYRFNQPQANRSYWSLNAYKGHLLDGNTGQNVILVTTNVGACDIRIYQSNTSGYCLRWAQSSGAGSEWILDQENTAGTLYLADRYDVRSSSLNNFLTKRGAGKAVLNPGTTLVTGLPAIKLVRILEGALEINLVTDPTTPINISSGATLSGFGNIRGSVTNNGTIWSGTNGAGTLTVGSMTMSAGSSLKFYSASVPTTNTVAMLNITNAATVSGSVAVSILSGGAAVGQYPLIHSVAAFTAPNFANFTLALLPPHVGGYLSNNTATASIDLVITNVAEPLTWATGSDTWQTNGSSIWSAPAVGSTTYQEANGAADSVLFEDTLSGGSPITVTLNETLIPPTTTVNNSSKNYIISGSGAVGGMGSLTKTGAGTLTLGTANTFTGGIKLNGGTTVFSALNNLGAGAISFGGGTLQYNGNSDDISVRTVTLGAGGGTIDVGSGDVIYYSGIGNGGAGGLTKAGSGSLTLSLTNNYTGNTVISNGKLILNGASYISNSAAIIVNSGTFFDVSYNGVIDLNGAVSQKLAGTGTVLGGVNLNNGTFISPATNGTYGTLSITNGSLTLNAGGTLNMDISSGSLDQINVGTAGYGLSINGGTVALNVSGTLPYGSYTLITYPSGSLFTGAASAGSMSISGFSQAGAVASLDGSVNGQINLVISPTASDTLTWSGTGATWDAIGTTDWYLTGGVTPWAFTNGDTVTFDEIGGTSPSVGLQAAVSPTAVIVSNNATSYFFYDGIGGGAGKISGAATLTKNGPGALTVGTENDTTGNVVISNGSVTVTGSLGSGNITNNAELIFNQTADHTVPGTLNGPGNLTKQGSTTLTLTANSPLFLGGVTISSGTLQLGNGGATGALGTTAGITNNGALSFNKSGTYTFANGIEGSGAVIKVGAATATLTGSNSYSGTTSVSAGKLINGSAYAHAGNGPLTIGNGATNDIGGYDLTIARLYSGNTTVGRIVNNSGSVTNTITINNPSSGSADCATVIADNDGAGGKIKVVVNGTGEETFRGANTYSGGTIINAGAALQTRGQNSAFGTGAVVLNGGTLHNYTATLSNPIQVLTNSTISSDGNSSMSTPITGSSNLNVYLYGTTTSGQTLTWNSAADLSGYSGTFFCTVDATTYGRFWRWGGTGGSDTAGWDLQGNMNMTVQAGGYTIHVGSLSGTNGTWLTANTTTYIVGGRNGNTTFSGNVSGSGSLNKIGTGTWTLDGTGYYVSTNLANAAYPFSGSTVVSNGVLHLTNGANPTNSSSIQINPGATLDVSGLGYEVFETNELDVVTNVYTAVTHRLDLSTNGNAQTLSGGGTLIGSVVAYPNSTITPGTGVGTLTVTTNVVLGGTLIMELNLTNTPATNDMLVAGGTITGGGTLTITNAGPALVAGDSFKLFSAPVSGFTATNLPTLGSGLAWTNKVAVDGTIAVLATIATYPTNITATVNGSSLEITWPATHLGWMVQAQTNALAVGLTNNWVTLSNTASVLGYTNTFNPANGAVFYRLVKP